MYEQIRIDFVVDEYRSVGKVELLNLPSDEILMTKINWGKKWFIDIRSF